MTSQIMQLNAICPYFTMFPIDFPNKILDEYSSEKIRTVSDPFCGRGTTNFAARLRGLQTIGVDTSPVAIAITSSKLISTDSFSIINEAKAILQTKSDVDIPSGDFWDNAYDKETLFDICKIRDALIEDCTSNERIALMGIMLGALHGPVGKTKKSYLSNQCPRTYAPKPAYSVRFWKKHNMHPLGIDVLDVIEHRANRYYNSTIPDCKSQVLLGDSTTHSTITKIKKNLGENGEGIDIIITSPPYLGMATYVQDQWIRNWFIGGSDKIDYGKGKQIDHTIKNFHIDLGKVWKNWQSISKKNSILAIRFGSIGSKSTNPREVIEKSLENTSWEIKSITSAGNPHASKKQSNSFSKTVRQTFEEIDVIARKYD